MASPIDVAVVGSGIAGSALARALARAGLAVLVLEHEREFRDKVRGENIPPWGVGEIHRLDLERVLLDAGGHYATRLVAYDDVFAPADAEARHFPVHALVPGSAGAFDVGHPQACEALSRAAEAAGARVLRGVEQVRVRSGSEPEVSYVHEGKEHSVRARLLVGADGRQSTLRKQFGLQLNETVARTNAAGLLVEGFDAYPSDCMSSGTSGDCYYIVTPRAGGVVRLYLLWDVANRSRFAGAEGQRRFLDAYGKYRFPFREQVMAAKPAGPCATYPMNDSYIDEPFVEGGVLIGDAAGWNDPIVGQGLSIALRDARLVSEILLAERGAWSKAMFAPYASERKERMRRLRISAQVATDIRCTFTPAGATRRAAWFETLLTDPIVAVTAVTPLVGPDVMPAEGYEPAAIERVLALGHSA